MALCLSGDIDWALWFCNIFANVLETQLACIDSQMSLKFNDGPMVMKRSLLFLQGLSFCSKNTHIYTVHEAAYN